jgi:DNA-binding protein HU-beta
MRARESSMNKASLVEVVARTLGRGTSKAQAERAVNAVIEALAHGLKRDRSISLSGFGSFEVRTRKGRLLKNPRTGAPMRVKATKRVAFKAGKNLKSLL